MKKRHFSHCRYCIPIHQAALLSRADPGVSRAFLYYLLPNICSVRHKISTIDVDIGNGDSIKMCSLYSRHDNVALVQF